MLDAALFGPPFVLIDARGDKVHVGRSIHDIEEAYALLDADSRATAVVGTLVDGVWAVDVDPADADADAAFGDAAAEVLVKWATQQQLGWWVRESGRPGGRHIFIQLPDDQMLDALRQQVVQLGRQLDVPPVHKQWLTVRKAMRLLGSPHRLGLPARNLGGTLPAAHLPGSSVSSGGRRARQPDTSPGRHRADRDTRTISAGGSRQCDTSRSGSEYGRIGACIRAGYTADQAWLGESACQVAGRGYDEWLRYMWSKMITVVAAEKGYNEDQAWAQVQRETPQRAIELGRQRWRSQVWQPALAEAATNRPRRYADPGAANNPDYIKSGGRGDTNQEDIEILRQGLRTAATDLLTKQGRRPQVHQTMAALMDTLAIAIACGDGRISLRRMAEESLLADSTVVTRRAEALQAGLITKVATYRDDGQCCDLYAIGPAASPYIQALRETRCSLVHPRAPRLSGHASLPLLRAAHVAQRLSYAPPVLTVTRIAEITAACSGSSSHVLSVIASRVAQRRWWNELSAEQKAYRRRLRRNVLDHDTPADRQASLDWLAQRECIDLSIDHILVGTASPEDYDTVASAPMITHYGRRDPLWRSGGTPPLHQRTDGEHQNSAQSELDLSWLRPSSSRNG